MGDADALDHRRTAKHRWRAGKAIEESNAGAKQKRHHVHVDFVDEPSVQ